MGETVKFSRLMDRLTELEYPQTRENAADACRDTTVSYAEGEDNLGDLIGGTTEPNFESATDLYEALQTELPVDAVGEPGQSEGDA